MKKKNKKEIKAKPWQIFSYYMMPFILGIITFFGFTKIVESSINNKLYVLPDIISKLNQNTLISLCLSLIFIASSYFLYWAVYVEGGKINFNRITFKSIIIPLSAVVIFYFLPNIFVFLHNAASILIHDEKYKYTYLLIHVLWTYNIFSLIYYKDIDIVKIMKNHYSFVLSIFTICIFFLAMFSEDSCITFILEHRLRTILVFYFAFCLPYIWYIFLELDNTKTYKYKDFLFRNDTSDGLLLVSGCFVIASIIYYYLRDIFIKGLYNLEKTLNNIILKLNSVSYIPVILTTLTIIFIGLAIYKTKKYLEKK